MAGSTAGCYSYPQTRLMMACSISRVQGEGVGTRCAVTAVLAGRHRQEPLAEVAQVERLSVASIPSQAVHADSEACAQRR